MIAMLRIGDIRYYSDAYRACRVHLSGIGFHSADMVLHRSILVSVNVRDTRIRRLSRVTGCIGGHWCLAFDLDALDVRP